MTRELAGAGSPLSPDHVVSIYLRTGTDAYETDAYKS